MRLGILGGTFDPIHFGHLRIAEEVFEEMALEKVLLMPGSLPPHKDRKTITPFLDRFFMTQAAAGDSLSLEAVDLEARREGLSYSIETLRETRKLYKTDLDLFFIIGSDAFMEIKSWKEYKNLFNEANFVVIKRPGFSLDDLEPFLTSISAGFKKGPNEDTFAHPSGNQLFYKKATLMEISSTNIREMVAAGKSIRFLVPEAVRKYILEKGLYSNNGNSG